MKPTILALLLALAPLTLPAQSGTWGLRGISHDFAAAGDVVFAADGRGVASYDVSGAQVRRVAVVPAAFETKSVALSAGEAFAAGSGGVVRLVAGAGGELSSEGVLEDAAGFEHVAADSQWIAAAGGTRIRFWRRSGFDEPIAGREISAGGTVESIVFVGGYLYAAVRDVSLYVFDPGTGARVGELPLAVRDLTANGTIVWAAIGGNGIASIDASVPTMPSLMGVASDVQRAIDGIAVSGTRVYGRSTPDLVTVFDGSTPREPRTVATLREPVTALAARGDRFFVAGSIIDSDGLPNETGAPLRVFDAQTLQMTAEFTDLAGPVSGVATDGVLAWVVDPPYFRVLDVSRTAMPRELASIRVPDLQDSVRVKRGLAVVYGRGRVNLIDVSDPAEPRHIGTYDSTGHPPSNASIARDTIVEANEHSGLHVVDDSNPSFPLTASRMWHYSDLTTSDDVIYALMTDNSMIVADISDRTQVAVAQAGFHDAVQLEIAPAAAPRPEFLVTRSATGFQIFGLANPLAPAPLKFVAVDRAGVMGTGESSVYFAKGGELWSIDLRAPAEPVATGFRLHSPMRVASARGKVVVADRYSVRIFGPDTTVPEPQPAMRRRAVRR